MTRSSAWTATNGSVQVPSQHKHYPVAYRPPDDVRDWLAAEHAATGQPVNAIITEALRAQAREQEGRTLTTQERSTPGAPPFTDRADGRGRAE